MHQNLMSEVLVQEIFTTNTIMAANNDDRDDDSQKTQPKNQTLQMLVMCMWVSCAECVLYAVQETCTRKTCTRKHETHSSQLLQVSWTIFLSMSLILFSIGP